MPVTSLTPSRAPDRIAPISQLDFQNMERFGLRVLPESVHDKQTSQLPILRCLAILLLALGHAMNLAAQAVSIASVTGRVVDAQGAVLPKATVRLVRVDTGSVYTAATNAEGLYTIPSVPIGTYTLEATAAGFQTAVCPARSDTPAFRVRSHLPQFAARPTSFSSWQTQQSVFHRCQRGLSAS